MAVAARPLARRAGDALTWKAVQLAGTKGMFLIRTLILARLLSPDDFGLLAVATVAIGFAMSITELGMTSALVHQPNLADGHYDSAWTVNMVRALCVSAVLLAAAPAIAMLFAEPRAVWILRLLALKPVIDASASIKVVEFIRRLDYRRTAFVHLPAVAVETSVSILLAMRLGVWALVAGALAGAVSVVVASYVLAPHRPRIVFSGQMVRPLIGYGRWIFLTGLVAVSASSLTQVVISRQLGAVELGLYFLAAKLAFLPHEIASQVTGEVAFSLFARLQDDRVGVKKVFRSLLVGSAAFLIPIYVLLIGLTPWLVQSVLGERWMGTEPLIQLLAVCGVVGLFGDVSVPLFRGLGYPKWILIIEFVQSGLLVVLIWSLTARYGVVGAPLAWLVAVGVSQVFSFAFAKRLLARPFANSIRPLALILLASLVGYVTAIVLHQVLSGLTGFLTAATLAVCVTGMALWLCDRHFDLALRSDLTQTFPRVAGLVGLVPSTR